MVFEKIKFLWSVRIFLIRNSVYSSLSATVRVSVNVFLDSVSPSILELSTPNFFDTLLAFLGTFCGKIVTIC